MVVVVRAIIITHYVLKPKEHDLFFFPFEPYSKIPAAFAFCVFYRFRFPLPASSPHPPCWHASILQPKKVTRNSEAVFSP